MNSLAKFLTIILLLVSSLSTSAADQPLWRYVDNNTLAVVRLDLTKLDRPATEKWLSDALTKNGADAQDVASLTAGLKKPFDIADELSRAGVHEIDFVLVLGIFSDIPGWIILPLEPGADVDKLARITSGRDDVQPTKTAAGETTYPVGGNTAIVKPGMILISPPVGHAMLAKLQPAERADLKAAFDEAPKDAALVAAFAPNDDTRKVLEQMMPNLPPPASVPSTVLTHGLRSGYLALALGVTPSLNLVVHSADAKAAADLQSLLSRMLDLLARDPIADKLIAAITPKVDGDHLSLALDTVATEQVVGLFATGVGRAREQAVRVQSMSNIKQLLLACLMYCNDHKGQWPDSLDQLAPYLGGKPTLDKVATNPRFPDRKPGYVYVKPPTDVAHTPPEVVMIYESFDEFPGPLAVGYADGHVETHGSKEAFDAAMAKSKKLLGEKK